MLCTADFCLIPFGTSNNVNPSVAPYIAECQKVLEQSGLTYKLHGYGTNIEGEWMQVCRAIEQCHEAVHKLGAVRIATDIRIGTRTDKSGTNDEKVKAVEKLLSNTSELSHSNMY